MNFLSLAQCRPLLILIPFVKIAEYITLIIFVDYLHHSVPVWLSTAPQEPLTHWYQVYIYMKLITLYKSSAIHKYTAPIMREKQSQINEG